uniref:Uncharacterized protein n=1 Tax=Steinernema glaseri TaxID=37863 RepID=A0A1I7YI45_9BILA
MHKRDFRPQSIAETVSLIQECNTTTPEEADHSSPSIFAHLILLSQLTWSTKSSAVFITLPMESRFIDESTLWMLPILRIEIRHVAWPDTRQPSTYHQHQKIT